MDENKTSEFTEEEYQKKLNSLDIEINNLVSSLNNLLDKEKELLILEAEKVKTQKQSAKEQMIVSENDDSIEIKDKIQKQGKIKSFFKSLLKKFKNSLNILNNKK